MGAAAARSRTRAAAVDVRLDPILDSVLAPDGLTDIALAQAAHAVTSRTASLARCAPRTQTAATIAVRLRAIRDAVGALRATTRLGTNIRPSRTEFVVRIAACRYPDAGARIRRASFARAAARDAAANAVDAIARLAITGGSACGTLRTGGAVSTAAINGRLVTIL
jgi:hypothetical protein